MTHSSPPVTVIGGGIIGLAVAWRTAQAGLDVTVIDDRPGRGASNVAAGMLAPVTEVHYGEEDLLRLTVAAARRWPGFAADLGKATGADVGYRQVGTILVAVDADDRRYLDELLQFQESLGLDVERLRSRDCRQLEPMLTPRIRGGLRAHEDHQVDPRRVVAALLDACRDAGVRLLADRVERIEHDGRRVTGAVLRSGGSVASEQVVLAAGSWSATIDGLPSALRPPVRPVKGQILRLRAREGLPTPSASVRGLVHGRSVYLVPRGDGRLVVGATQEEQSFDTGVTAGGVRTLLDDAVAVLPGIDEYELVETIAGLRPATPDNRPLVGATDLEGLVLATGHFRNGILHTPLTAEAVAALLSGVATPPEIAVADPRRGAAQPDHQPRQGAPGRKP